MNLIPEPFKECHGIENSMRRAIYGLYKSEV
jgi:hypothetical protein